MLATRHGGATYSFIYIYNILRRLLTYVTEGKPQKTVLRTWPLRKNTVFEALKKILEIFLWPLSSIGGGVRP